MIVAMKAGSESQKNKESSESIQLISTVKG